jgi:putative alpha-1,2-mannosidase
VQLADAKALEIRAENHAPDRAYVAAVSLNGTAFDALEVPHAALVGGGELVFTMTDDADLARARGRLRRPFSLSTAWPHLSPRGVRP